MKTRYYAAALFGFFGMIGMAQVPGGIRRSRPATTADPRDVMQRDLNQQQQPIKMDFQTNQPSTEFKNLCFSNICVGDYLDKLVQANVSWSGAAQKPVPKTVSTRRTTRTVDPTSGLVGLNDADRARLAQSMARNDGQFDKFIKLPYGYEGPQILVLDSEVLRILKSVHVCSFQLIFGIFKSESGHDTGVLVLPNVDGNFRVMFMRRIYNLSVPANVSEEQSVRAFASQIEQLVKQINELYGTTWWTNRSDRDNMAVGSENVAYFSIPEYAHPYLSLYMKDLAQWQSYQSHTFMTGGNAHLRIPPEEPVQWELLFSAMNQGYANIAACQVKTEPVKIQ